MASGSTIRQRSRSLRLAPRVAELLVAARGDRPRSEVAASAGVAASTLAALERGEANPTLAYLEGLEAVYGCRFELTIVDPASGAVFR